MRFRRFSSLTLPVALLATGGCLATRSDIERLQLQVKASQDATTLRQNRSDSVTQALVRDMGQMITQQFTRQFAVVSDSVRQVSSALQKLQGDVQLAMHDVKSQLTTLQEGLGQSQRRLQDLRTSVEARENSSPRPADPAAPGGSTGAAPGVPSGATLWQTGSAQLDRNAISSARMNFQLLVDTYPTHDRAPDAQHAIAKTYAAEGNRAAEDSVYALVVQKFPNSGVAPNSLYKRAQLALGLKDSVRAKGFFEQIVAKYPRSNERTLADEFLNPPKKP